MKLFRFFSQLLVFCCFSTNTWGLFLDDLHEREGLSLESTEPGILSYKALSKEENGLIANKNATSRDSAFQQSMSLETSMKEDDRIKSIAPKDKQFIASDNSDYYLFSQEELDAQQPGLELFQSLSPMLSQEMKKDAKKIWAESGDIREAINFSTIASGSKKLILHHSANEMTLLKGKTLTGISNANLTQLDNKESNNALVSVLFDDFHELLKNALLIVVGIFIFVKSISLMLITLTKSGKRRRKRKARGRRRKRRSRRARLKMG